jgi:hypothetical protein
MNDRVSHVRTETSVLSRTTADLDGPEDFGCFGWLRGVRDRAVMLEIRKKTGDIMAISYGWIERAEFNPSEGITLHLAGRSIRISGKNLNAEIRPMIRLFEGICRHRVPWVAQAGSQFGTEKNSSGISVDSIEW